MTESNITITTADTARILVSRWDAPSGRSFVALTPQYQDRRGEWRLSHSAVTFLPGSAAELAAAIVETAVRIEGAPIDPVPTADDRDLSRMP